ncbi:efflux RND transporter periplasmic adaptor subunit [Gaoshiqia sediminis]|uniref:Efflux RND transporter periplasmic adaptor subunit n=1 Tax=Gaoshiqia sediminis TaxID=2986998 RepID=A0AA41Y5S2_9BACT|nr:efflux RND transporter periplasmic adaptor subunit [Gaoshiqia sediminis]MCW0482355.1 efflux RND transporter periplasmic adaptor subunit [Gaoshiqia sediminis]
MKKKIIYSILAVAIIAAGIISFWSFSKAGQTVELETAAVIRGEISDVITATGTLEAVETVEVGTQVSGVIRKIYVDYNSQVKKGQLLARLDETPLVAQLEQSKATVDQAEAEVQYQKATYDRYQVLIEKKLIAQSDYDLVVYNYNKAVASLNNARSVYDKNKINLSYATICSPIDGIILDRAVDEGQTVAASFNTPTLFTIANDLTQMQVEANVDEADIGNVRIGQRVEFTVDAYPTLKFDGEVIQIRLQPVESSNVITYTVVINAPNPDKKLMPGMTANASFYVKELKGIPLMPAKALNFNPDQKLLMAYQEAHPEVNLQLPETGMTDSGEQGKTVWVKKGNVIRSQQVTLGETDEAFYEVISGLDEGDEVLVSLIQSTAAAGEKSAARSPFMPQRPGNNRK